MGIRIHFHACDQCRSDQQGNAACGDPHSHEGLPVLPVKWGSGIPILTGSQNFYDTGATSCSYSRTRQEGDHAQARPQRSRAVLS